MLRGEIIDKHIVIHILISVCEPETLKLFEQNHIPEKMLAIRPCGDLVAVNDYRDTYFVLTEKQ